MCDGVMILGGGGMENGLLKLKACCTPENGSLVWVLCCILTGR